MNRRKDREQRSDRGFDPSRSSRFLRRDISLTSTLSLSLSLFRHQQRYRMSNNAFALKLPERYTAPPNEEQFAILQLRRKRALSNPLQPNQSLKFKSSNLHPGSTARIGQTKSAHCTSPNPLRPLNDRLLRALEGARDGSDSLELRLVEELQGKEEKWSQVWLCTVELGEEIVGEVVVKFLAESLFTYPQETWWRPGIFRWMSAPEIEMREARA